MTRNNTGNFITIYISLPEKEIIEKYTNTPLVIIRKIEASIENAKLKRKVIKRVSVIFTVKELDTLIANIAEKANQGNVSLSIQNILGSLFGRLAEKYNKSISELKSL